MDEATAAAFDRECLEEFNVTLTGKYRHFCWDWDFLPIDETCPEFDACVCYPREKE